MNYFFLIIYDKILNQFIFKGKREFQFNSVNLSMMNGFSEDDEQFVQHLNEPRSNRLLINHSNLLPVSRNLTFGP